MAASEGGGVGRLLDASTSLLDTEDAAGCRLAVGFAEVVGSVRQKKVG